MSLLDRLDRIPLSRPHYLLLVMGGLGYTFDGMDAAIVAFLLPSVKTEWGLSAAPSSRSSPRPHRTTRCSSAPACSPAWARVPRARSSPRSSRSACPCPARLVPRRPGRLLLLRVRRRGPDRPVRGPAVRLGLAVGPGRHGRAGAHGPVVAPVPAGVAALPVAPRADGRGGAGRRRLRATRGGVPGHRAAPRPAVGGGPGADRGDGSVEPGGPTGSPAPSGASAASRHRRSSGSSRPRSVSPGCSP
jgi:hypothetical protein